MVCMEIHISKKSPYFKTQTANPGNINPEKYKEEMEKSLRELNQQESLGAQNLYNGLERCLTKAARRALSTDKCVERRNKLKESTRHLMEEREKQKSEAAINPQKRKDCEEMNKRTQREIRRDIKEYNTEKVKKVMERSKSVKKFRKEITYGKHWMLGVKDANGKRLSSRGEIVRQATEFYKKLYSSTLAKDNSTQNYMIPERNQEEEDIPIIPSEVRRAIEEAKNEKCQARTTYSTNI